MQSSALHNEAGNPGGEIPIAKLTLALICVPKQELGNEMKRRKGFRRFFVGPALSATPSIGSQIYLAEYWPQYSSPWGRRWEGEVEAMPSNFQPSPPPVLPHQGGGRKNLQPLVR
jgi:hypothetical protein